MTPSQHSDRLSRIAAEAKLRAERMTKLHGDIETLLAAAERELLGLKTALARIGGRPNDAGELVGKSQPIKRARVMRAPLPAPQFIDIDGVSATATSTADGSALVRTSRPFGTVEAPPALPHPIEAAE